MGMMNLPLTGGQRPSYTSLLSTATPAVSQDATLPPAAANNIMIPSQAGPTNSAPQADMMKIMGLMVGLLSQIIGMMGGSASGPSPFAGALDNSTPGAVKSTVPPVAGGVTTPGLSPYGIGGIPTPAPTGMGTTGLPGVASPTPSSLDTSGNLASLMGSYGGLPPTPPAVTTPPAADTMGLQQCPNGTGATDMMGNPIPPTSTVTGTPPVGTTIPGITPPVTTPPATTPPTTATAPVADDGSHPVNVFTASDYKNFLLAGSQGGTTGTAESINSKYADPNSRFAKTGNPQFQAAIAGMYANQFKGYALGADVAYTPGKDINKMASDLTQVQNTQMTPEAEMLSKVASLYRGELTGVNLYDNPKLKTLLQSWGRNDIASQPNVGNPNGDVQSIGGVVKALNEEKDPTIRKAWLQQIFDFAGNSPSSPSGAVPNLPQYQQAISLVRDGTFNSLLNGYQQTAGT